MRLTAERSALLSVLNSVRGATGRGHTVPIMTNLLIEAESNICRMVASNLNQEIVSSCDADVIETGAITVSAERLSETLRGFPEGSDVLIELSKLQLSIKCGRSTIKLPTLPAGDFGRMLPEGLDTSFEIDGPSLLRMIEKASPFANTDIAAGAFGGACLHIAGSMLRLAATDRNSLGYAEIMRPQGIPDDLRLTIPLEALNACKPLCMGSVRLSMSKHAIRLESEFSSMVSRLIDIPYPSYERALVDTPPLECTVDKKTLSNALKQAMIAVDDRDRTVCLSFSNGEIGLSSSATYGGQVEAHIECGYVGEEVIRRYNGNRLLKALATLDGETVQLRFNDKPGPLLMLDETASDYLLLVMSHVV